MACMTHSCPCGWDWFDNNASGDCPKCGNDRGIGHFYDEEDMDMGEEDTDIDEEDDDEEENL